MYINSISSIEVTFVNITFQSSEQEDLSDSLSVCLSHAKTNQIKGKFLKKWGVFNWPN